MTVLVEVTEDIDTCLNIRRTVFVEEQGVTLADELDGKDGDAIHLLAQEDGKSVGTARILIQGNDAKVGRVAVLKPFRGSGLGAAIIEAAVELARHQQDVFRVVLGAQTYAIGFYERLGFSAFGPVYDDAGIPHRDMEMKV